MTVYDDSILLLAPWAYWPMDEASGNPQDVSGNARHMTSLVGTHARQQAAIAEHLPLSHQLVSGNSYLTIPSAGSWGTGTEWCWEWWGRRTGGTGGSGSYTLNIWAGSQSRPLMVSVNADSVYAGTAAGSSTAQDSINSPVGLETAKPHHIVAGFTADDVGHVWFNGRKVASGAMRRWGSGNVRFGYTPDAFWGGFHGYVSNLAHYRRMLTKGEIQHHYRLGLQGLRHGVAVGGGYGS